MKLVSKIEAGKRRVYDIEVSEVHNFYANGVNVHNCTGLPTPTIAVATNGGVSVVKDNGVVVNSAYAGISYSPSFSGKRLYFQRAGASAGFNSVLVEGIAAGFAGDAYTGSATTPETNGSYPLGFDSRVALRGQATTPGVHVIMENPASPTKSVLAKITNAYNSGWQVGDIRGCWLADTVAETIVGSGELVTNGTFATDTNWTKQSGWTISGGAAVHTGGGSFITPVVAVTLDASKTYVITVVITSWTSGDMGIAVAGSIPANAYVAHAAGTYTFTISNLSGALSAYSTGTISVGDISCKLAEPDRSVKNTGMTIVGSLVKSPVASGAELVSYSGFSAANYLEQPYNSALDFGTGDFCVMGWVNLTGLTEGSLVKRFTTGAGTLWLYVNSVGILCYSCSATEVAVNSGIPARLGLQFVAMYRESGVLRIAVDAVPSYSVANTANITNTAAKLFVGSAGTVSPCLGSLTLWRISATAPSADQIAHIYRTELPLFQPNAKCTIDGTSTAVTALAYDDSTELLQVGTSWGRSSFKDLLRVDSEVSTVGAITSISASGGAISTGGATSAYFYQPALLLRDELKRKDEARKALGKTPVFFEFDAIAAQTAFLVPKGFTAKAVYSAEALKREGATKTYTRSFDGFAETINFAVAPGASVWVSIMCVRS